MPDLIFPTNIDDAVIVQDALRQRVRLENDFAPPRTIAGVDASYDIQNNLTRAFVMVFDLATLRPLARAKAIGPTTFPYVPGFLSFREIPTILEAFAKLQTRPDIVMVDGQGVAHPRRLGIASHLGVLMDLPTIGVAKSRLTGWHSEPGLQKGDRTLLTHRKEQIGTVLRSKNNTKPLYISPGHRMDHETAVAITLQCLTTYRLPEPTRLADKWSKEKGPDVDPTPLLL